MTLLGYEHRANLNAKPIGSGSALASTGRADFPEGYRSLLVRGYVYSHGFLVVL